MPHAGGRCCHPLGKPMTRSTSSASATRVGSAAQSQVSRSNQTHAIENVQHACDGVWALCLSVPTVSHSCIYGRSPGKVSLDLCTRSRDIACPHGSLFVDHHTHPCHCLAVSSTHFGRLIFSMHYAGSGGVYNLYTICATGCRGASEVPEVAAGKDARLCPAQPHLPAGQAGQGTMLHTLHHSKAWL